jgi:hypothetical protein
MTRGATLEAALGFEPKYGALQAPYSRAAKCHGVPESSVLLHVSTETIQQKGYRAR